MQSHFRPYIGLPSGIFIIFILQDFLEEDNPVGGLLHAVGGKNPEPFSKLLEVPDWSNQVEGSVNGYSHVSHSTASRAECKG